MVEVTVVVSVTVDKQAGVPAGVQPVKTDVTASVSVVVVVPAVIVMMRVTVATPPLFCLHAINFLI